MQCLTRHTRPAPALARRLLSSVPTQRPPQSTQDLPEKYAPIYDQNFARPTLQSFHVFRRFAKFTLVGLFTLGFTTYTAFEGLHMYVEKVELAVEDDEDLRTWAWIQQAEHWSGGSSGGTDPALGYKGRHAVRGAWIAQHWGAGTNIATNNTLSGTARADGGGIHSIDAGLEYAHDFLNVALVAAVAKHQSGDLRPNTITDLLTRHANVLERMGSKSSLFGARSGYERVWAGLPGKGPEAAHVAWKIGDLCSRLGDGDEALDWWTRSLLLVDDQRNPILTGSGPILPEVLPSHPLAQRTVASVLSSLSAHYAQAGQLKQAQAVEEAGLDLLESAGSSALISPRISPPQRLHQLFLVHRSSLLSIHLGEVLYALRKDPMLSLKYLRSAADASEKVALTLSGLPLTHADVPSSSTPPPPSSEQPLHDAYGKSRAIRTQASSLLRDARRSAVQAWNLAGLVLENDAKNGSQEKALECYERALGWAGVAADAHGGIGRPAEGILEKEWTSIWSNYTRLRDVVRGKDRVK